MVEQPHEGGDLKDWPRIAKLQSDLLVHALASGQTRVASYMLTKCQGLSRFPGSGTPRSAITSTRTAQVESPRGHAHSARYLPLARGGVRLPGGQLKATPEGDGTLLDHTCLLFVHEHAEANIHKNNGLAVIVAGHAGNMQTGCIPA